LDRSTTCVACGSDQANKTFKTNEKMFGLGGEFIYLECNACQSLQLVDIPLELSTYYPADYYAFGGMVNSGIIFQLMKRIRWKLFKHHIYFPNSPKYLSWLTALEAKEEHAIADIGCGNGQILYELKCSGFKNLKGFDPYLSQEVALSGFSLKRKGLFEIEEKFDIITLHHSFEHMEDPIKVMSKLSDLLNPNGKLLIRLPVTDGEIWEKEGVNWFQLDAPRHLFIPSVKAMNLIGQSAGLTLKNVVFDSTMYQFVITELYKRGKKFLGFNKWREQFTASQLKEFKNLATVYNLNQKGDQVCLYFEK
jgi:SAM-dependent methyltransferase